MQRRGYLKDIMANATGSHGPSGIIVHYTFMSETLGREYPYNIYLPAGYECSTTVYPVLYLLHGSNGNENDWPINGAIQYTVERLIATGSIPPAIIVMPGSRSWWVDGYNENAEAAFFKDLIPHVESTWRVIAERDGRVIAGLSAGGYGTVNFALKHPDTFAAGAALSPASYVPQPPANSSAMTHPAFLTSEGDFDAELWQTLNYPSHIDDYETQDTIVPLFISSGDDDVFDIAYHGAVLYQALRDHQPEDVEFRVVDGGHDWRVWREVLPEALIYMFGFASRPRGAMPLPAIACRCHPRGSCYAQTSSSH